MEAWQKEIIIHNMAQLINLTMCNTTLLSKLQSSGVLSDDDIEQLKGLESNRTNQSYELYSILLKRTNAYASLREGLEGTNQSGALQILKPGVDDRDDFKSVTFDKQVELGKGSYGTVYKGKFGDRDVAVKRIKILKSDHFDYTQVVNEINTLKECDKHENIVRYFGCKTSGKFFLIVLEICEMTLTFWVNEKSIDTSPMEVLRQTTVGLGWLHEHKIVHRDLKPDNILFTRNPVRIKISDFGLSRKIKDDRSFVSTSSIGGTQGWVAPEILTEALRGNPRLCRFTFESDIFALGCVYYFVITDGKHAFGDPIRCQGNILDGKPVLDENGIIHGCQQNVLFVKLMISQNPKWRPSCSALLTCPIFWNIDRHKSFILDLIGMNKSILCSDQNQKCQRTCKLCQRKMDEMILTLECQQNNISLCSNNVTYLQINLPLFYKSCSELHIHEITEYLGYTIQKPLNSTTIASGTLNTNNVENYAKPIEESTGQTRKGKEKDQSERENKAEQKENRCTEIISIQLQHAIETNNFQKSQRLANDSTSKEDQIVLSEEYTLNQESDSSEEDKEGNMSDTPLEATNASKSLQIKRKLEDKLKGEGSKCLELYKNAMDVFRNGEFFDEKKLLKSHEANSKIVFSSFDEKTKNDDLESVNFHRKQLKTAIEEVFLKLKNANAAAVELAKSKAKNLITDCVKYYTDAMRETITFCETDKDFAAVHEKVKVEVLGIFNIEWSATYKSMDFLEEFMQDLKDQMDWSFPELLDLLQMNKKIGNKKTNYAKKEAWTYYHKEMETHMKNNHFIKFELLKKMHNQAAQTALKHCTNANVLKEPQLAILKQSLENCYKQYENKITMTLNYEFGSEPAIGIDLGTTYCCVAVFFKGRTIVIRNAQGSNTTASYVCINPDGNHSIGNLAKENAFTRLENTVYDVKRILGRNFTDKQLQDDMKFWPFAVVDGKEGPTIQIGQKQYPPEQIASILLRDLVKQAEEIIGIPIKRAVVTVPAYFTDGQRQATKDAADIAGLELLQILDEPTAAALAYKLERFYEDARKVLVYDLGGGTFDISILELEGGNIKILNKDGDTHLGGEDFDKAMMVYCVAEFKKQHGLDPFEGKDSTQNRAKDATKRRLRRLQTYCERGKIELSTSITTTISIDGFFKEKDFLVAVSRTKFEQLNAVHFERTLKIVERSLNKIGLAKTEIDDIVLVERSLNKIGLAKTEIDDIVLVGGSTRIPKVKEMLSEYFDGKVLNHAVHPNEAVAYGAAVQAALLNGGIAKKDLTFRKIEDVTPMSLGVEAYVGGVRGGFSPIIPKNTPISTIHKEVYSTAKDNQTSISLKIFQGESAVAKENVFLGEFVLTGITPRAAGKENIDVIMEIDRMGVLSVKAIVKNSGRVEKLVVNENKPAQINKTRKEQLLEEMQAMELLTVGVSVP